ITEWTPHSTIGVRHLGVVTGTGRFTLTPIDLGRRTRFGWQESLKFPWWLGGQPSALVGGRAVLRPMWKHNLSSLKRLVESEFASDDSRSEIARTSAVTTTPTTITSTNGALRQAAITA